MEHSMIHGGVIRRLWPADLPAFREHLLRLDTQSRFDRFAMAVNDAFLIRYAERCFGIDDVIYGYYVDGTMRGAGELRAVGNNIIGGSVEAAFSVELAWRRRGVGTELMDRIVRAARNRRADGLYMSCLARNVAMQALARKFEADLLFETDDLTGRFVARGPSAASFWGEFADNATSFATAMLDLQTRVFSLQPRA
ncbi:GNAT family N-acetyltransferase [uncultured Rhodoblastus sp.]|uniref:GNAT family N-acetyltransferase n=1 Tax=uncultured Rhodoblastus sp. TaxID=543037 RepID=UPI0025DF2AD8|nr:GNAT family N-acetyltransferase [uncultured Rhodoblastus sp.]